jgi:hypothetical protein
MIGCGLWDLRKLVGQAMALNRHPVDIDAGGASERRCLRRASSLRIGRILRRVEVASDSRHADAGISATLVNHHFDGFWYGSAESDAHVG